MGQGGDVVLVNGTKYAWDRTGCGAYQMEWMFGKEYSCAVTIGFAPDSNQTLLSRSTLKRRTSTSARVMTVDMPSTP